MAQVNQDALKTLKQTSALQQVNQGKRRTLSIPLNYTHIDETFVGDVVVHHPSMMEKLQVGVTRAQLLGGVVPLDTMTDNLSQIIATLDVVIDSKPGWFDIFSDTVEYEILEDVYVQYMNWVNAFRNNTRRDTDKGTSEDKQG